MPIHYFNRVSFYIVAHADDWQLFMFPNVYKDLTERCHKVIFIITTAGDAGMNENYWMAREEGSKSSVRFCFAPFKKFLQLEECKECNEHTIQYAQISNAGFYFLRLPDGNIDGCGSPCYNFQSISKFKNGEIDSITAVDNSAAYNSWDNFLMTLQCIIDAESNGVDDLSVHYINPDVLINPNDHADHIATGKAIECVSKIKNAKRVLYKGYSVTQNQHKLNNTDFFYKTSMFAAYDKTVFDNSGYSTLAEGANTYIEWCACSADYIVMKPGFADMKAL